MIDWTEYNRCKKWLEDALEYNDTGQTLDDVERGLQTGEYLLWPGRNSAVVTEHFETPQGKFLNFFLAGGDLDELAQMLKPIEDWARADGVSKITLYGRRGWARSFMKQAGYQTRWVVMTKDI